MHTLEHSTTSIQTIEADKPSGAGAAAAYEPDAAEVDALARMLYGEARGIASDMEKAACVWCVLNRVDDPRFPDTVLEVLEAPKQFSGYKADYPVIPELQALAADVLTRYQAERDGDTEAGRVLPAEYVFFTGDGKNNHFTAECRRLKHRRAGRRRYVLLPRGRLYLHGRLVRLRSLA